MTIHIITEASVYRNLSPEDVTPEQSFAQLRHLPKVGDILRLADDWKNSKCFRNYYEVTGILHDLRDENDVDIFVVVKPYSHLQQPMKSIEFTPEELTAIAEVLNDHILNGFAKDNDDPIVTALMKVAPETEKPYEDEEDTEVKQWLPKYLIGWDMSITSKLTPKSGKS